MKKTMTLNEAVEIYFNIKKLSNKGLPIEYALTRNETKLKPLHDEFEVSKTDLINTHAVLDENGYVKLKEGKTQLATLNDIEFGDNLKEFNRKWHALLTKEVEIDLYEVDLERKVVIEGVSQKLEHLLEEKLIANSEIDTSLLKPLFGTILITKEEPIVKKEEITTISETKLEVVKDAPIE